MSQTVIRGTQILNNTVQRQDLDVSTVGQAVVTKIVQGSGITLSSTGADSGTGDVTVTAASTFITKAAAYTLTTADSGKYVICSGGSWTLTLPAPVAGLYYRLRNDMGISGTTGTITLTPTGGTIDGLASISLLPQQECTVITDGTNWRTFGLKREVILGTQDITSSTASGTVLLPVGYRMFVLEWGDLLSVTDQVNLQAFFSIDGGATFLSTGYFWGLGYLSAAATWTPQIVNNTSYALIGPQVNGTNPFGQCSLKLYPGKGGSIYPNYIADAGNYSNIGPFSQRWVIYGFNGTTGTAGPVNALKYSVASGNITNSFLTVKGVV